MFANCFYIYDNDHKTVTNNDHWYVSQSCDKIIQHKRYKANSMGKILLPHHQPLRFSKVNVKAGQIRFAPIQWHEFIK